MRKLVMLMAAMVAAVCAMAQGSFYVVMKDGSAEKFPVEKVDSLTFDNIDAEKVLGMGDLMKVVDGLKGELDSLKGENDALKKANEELKDANLRSAVVGTWNGVKQIKEGDTTKAGGTLVITEKKFNGVSYSMNGNILTTIELTTGRGGQTAVKTTPYTIDKATVDTLVITSLNGLAKITTIYVGVDEHDALSKSIATLEAKIASLEKVNQRIDSVVIDINSKLDFGHAVVDLGLPSGTLWATCNVGAKTPYEKGNLYAWGETETKSEYTEYNSKMHGILCSKLQSAGILSSKWNLTAEYDAATANWGENWRMPTKDEIKELAELNSEEVVISGVRGRLLTGNNGNTLFLPYSESFYHETLKKQTGEGDYWSATSLQGDSGHQSYELSISFRGETGGRSVELSNTPYRYEGHMVRPVLKK